MRHLGKRAQRGVALIEVLVSFLILVVGLIGFSALQVGAMKATQSSLQRTDAAFLANYVLEAMRANKASAIGASYALTNSCAPGFSSPTAGTLANADLIAWFSALKTALGSVGTTCVDITCTGSAAATPGMCTVNIRWDDSRALGGSSTQQVQMVGRL
jgi:type IV pilus assembly protein PilV